MGGNRSGERRRRLVAATVALGLLASVAATTAAAAQEPPAPDPPSDQQPEPTTDEPAQAPVDWTTEPTPTTAPPATDPAARTDTTTSPPGATELPPTTGPASAAPPDDAGTTTTGTTAPTGDAALEPPAPVVGAANPVTGAQGFAVLVAGGLRGGGTSAGAVAAGGDIAADPYAVAGTTSTFGRPVAALAGGRITGSLTTVPAGAVAAGVADPAASPAVLAAPGAFARAFAGVFDDLAARSRSLASMPPTVTPTDADGTPLADLDGADVHLALQPGVNTWTVSADDLAAVASLTVDGTPTADQPLVVSVTGADVTLDRPTAVPPGGDAGLLWNLPDATTATVGAALPGSLLAPGATVALRADLGGTLVAASLDQQAPAAVGAVPFGADLPTADEVAGATAGDPAAVVPVPDPGGPSVFLVPTPGAGQAVISVKVGGDRTGIIGVTALAGVVLQLFDGGGGGGTTPVTDSWATCTSDADGDCSFVVPNTAAGGANAGRRFWVRQVSAPAGWFANDDLRVGSNPTAPDLYEFRTPANLSAGNTYLTTGPTASWMLGTGGATDASGGIWQNSRTNPAFPAQCGLRVALVLDVSGSAPQDGVRTAGTAFVSGLSGTPSEVAVFTFSSDAPANTTNNQNRPLTSVSTAANVTTVNGWINGVTTGGGTNWDRGMAQVAESTTDFDVAVVVTDGDPTFYNQPFEGPGSSTRFREMENAIFSANAVKAEGTRIVAVGVGAGVSGGAQNLIAVSGSTVNSDYFQTSNYTAAAATLRALALGSCQGAISVVKQVVPNGTPAGSTAGASPAGGWDFAASTATTGVTIDPPAGTTADATGALSFALSFPGGTTSAPVSITETVQPGFTLHQGAVGQNAVCTRLDTGASVPITNLPTGFTVTGSSTFPVSCLVYNQAPPLVVPASIQVDKTWVVDGVSFPDGSQPAGMTAELLLAGTSQPWGTARTGLVAGDSVGIAETVTITLPLCTLAGQVLTPVTPAGPPGSLPDDVELVGGANLYSVTNTVTCQAQLTLLKEVLPAGSVDPTLWALDAAAPAGAAPGPSGTTGATSLVTPLELYTLSESGGDPRFAQRVGPNAVPIPGSTISWACVLVDETGAPIPPGTVFDGLNGGVRPPLGQRTSCTASNVAVPLTFVKTVVNDDGGTATPGDFLLTATPIGPLPLPAGLGPVTVPGSATGTEVLVRPGIAYVLSETGPDGYVETSLVCQVADQTPPPRQVVIGFGQAGICTFTNNDQPASLTLVKTVTNDNGGTEAPGAWTLTATGPTTITGATGTAPVTAAAVSAGTYVLSEAGPAGYTASAWSCTGGGTLTGSSLVLTPGVSATCTIDNNDQPASLTLVKTVTNDSGGTAAPAAWTLTATGPTTITGATGTAPVTAASVSAGTYVLSEAGPAGYTASAWSCTGGGTLTGSSLVLTPGVSATCTIDNNDQPASLTLEKTVTNDNGGMAAPAAWTLTATGPTTITGATGTAPVTAASVSAGTYVLSESAGAPGYTASAWECDAGTLTGSSLVLTPGVTATCSIENDDQPASLTLEKTVINDDGGTAVPTDWTLGADGPTPIEGVMGDPAVTGAAVDAGTYTLSESAGAPGYTASAWECDAGTLTGSSLVLTPGVSATCTIDNNDQPATLTLEKTVDNGTTGTAVATDWTLSATGPVTISGPSGDPAVTAAPVEVGAYDLAETGPDGYTASDWTCTAAVGEEPPAALDVVDGSVSLTEGVAATCTIVNTAVPPTPPTTAPPTTAPPTTTPAPPSDQAAPPVCPAVITPLQSAEEDCPPLPFTGLEAAELAAVAAALIGVGAAFVVVRRRRRAHAQG